MRSSHLHQSQHCSSYSWHSGDEESSPQKEHEPVRGIMCYSIRRQRYSVHEGKDDTFSSV